MATFDKGTSYITLPVTPNGQGDDKNLFEGRYSVTETPDNVRKSVTEGNDIIGVGGSKDLQNEITAREGAFVRIPADGDIKEMQPEDGIAFGHFSSFTPEVSGDIDFAENRPALVEKLQTLLGGYKNSFTAKIKGDFDVLMVRTPNHDCSPAPHIKEALGGEVHFYFMHDATVEQNTRIYYKDLEDNVALAAKLGFEKNDAGAFVKKLKQIEGKAQNTIQEVEVNEIILRPGDQLTLHKEPLKMTVVAQYAPNHDIFEMGGAAGLHLHTDGKLGDTLIGGHILGFVGLRNAKAEAMKVNQTYVQEKEGVIREAYTQQTIAKDIVARALGYAAFVKDKAVELTKEAMDFAVRNLGIAAVKDATLSPEAEQLIPQVKPMAAKDFQQEEANPWSSFVRNDEQRNARIAELTKVQDEDFVSAVERQRTAEELAIIAR